VTVPDEAPLTTFAPTITHPPDNIPTGNLWVSLPRIDRSTGSVRTIAVLHEGTRGMLEAWGDDSGVLVPFVEVDGVAQPLTEVSWARERHWLPRMAARCGEGEVDVSYCAPVGERGAAFRLAYRPDPDASPKVVVGWRVQWQETALVQLRTKPLDLEIGSDPDPWTGSHVLHGTMGLPLLALGLQAGPGATLAPQGRGCVVSAQAGQGAAGEFVADVFVAVAPERDGAAATALHLRRRGFDDMWASSVAWLAAHELPTVELDARDGLDRRLNENAFFNFFFAQGDCLDTGRSVIVTSRSSDYYVSAAFWSRDAYQWTFPALLLVDPVRARKLLVSSIAGAGDRLADHALYINGTHLYPGFELDQAAAPVLAVHLYASSTGDWGVLDERAVRELCDGFVARLAPWRSDELGLYATFLLPTDDPTSHPYTTTGNALVRAAFDALARLHSMRGTPEGAVADDYVALSDELGAAIADLLGADGSYGPMWAWGRDEHGGRDIRDEPPLSLLTLPYWGLCDAQDARQRATRRWLETDNPYRYAGDHPGAGSPHFPFPSGFDLANRLLTDPGDGPLQQLVTTPMDHGLGCESWDSTTGVVTTGAAMASMAGLLTWTAWSRLTGRSIWHAPLALPQRGPRL
jgi:hypothetical protein